MLNFLQDIVNDILKINELESFEKKKKIMKQLL